MFEYLVFKSVWSSIYLFLFFFLFFSQDWIPFLFQLTSLLDFCFLKIRKNVGRSKMFFWMS